MNEHCYTRKILNYKNGIFDSIDCTYIITTYNSTRIDKLIDTINKIRPTKKVVVQYNKTYKNCNKKLEKYLVNYDLSDANIHAFKHAITNNFKRVLVLEDDCEFDDRIHNKRITNSINKFLKLKNPDIYNFGTTISITNPFDILFKEHQLLLLNSCAHATVYSERYMKDIVKRGGHILGHVDFNTNMYMSKYTFHKPIAYQKILPTENAINNWSIYYYISKPFFDLLHLDKKVQPGFDILKIIHDFISIFIFIFIIVILLR